LDYASPRQHKPLANERWLGWLTAIVPCVVLPSFVLGTAVLQDDLVADGPGSWHRAALRAGIPAQLITVCTLTCAIWAVRQMGWRSAAGVAVAANAFALAVIAYEIFSA
jgi:hypothetical protein